MSILDLEQQEKVLNKLNNQKYVKEIISKQNFEKKDEIIEIDYEEWLQIFEEDEVMMEGCR